MTRRVRDIHEFDKPCENRWPFVESYCDPDASSVLEFRSAFARLIRSDVQDRRKSYNEDSCSCGRRGD
jgi:hypothetical protein